MYSQVQSFLESEITCFPNIMQRSIGKFYSNTLYNGITWMVFILHIIRFTFELAVNALFRKMGFKEYLRIRLRKSLWYLGFYSCSYLYCSATLWKNDITLPDPEKFLILDLTQPISGHLILGYVLLCAFFISSAMWEGLICSLLSLNYLFLTSFVAFTYFLSYIELAVLLASNISVFHIITEFCRCLSSTIKVHLNLPRNLVNITFMLSVAVFVISYFIVIPRRYMLPLGQGLMYNTNSAILISLNVSLWCWFLCEIYQSPVYRLLLHLWRHQCNVTNIVPQCLGSVIDCALFEPRDDVAYNLTIIRKEMKEEEERLRKLRKPKQNVKVLLQTLKCMATINRRIQQKRKLKNAKEEWKNEDEEEISSTIFDVNDENEVIETEQVTDEENKNFEAESLIESQDTKPSVSGSEEQML